MRRRALPPILLLVAITGVGTGLRLWGLDRGFWYDEVVTWRVLQPLPFFGGQLGRWPHLFFLLRVWGTLTGQWSEFWLRLPMVFYGIACIPLVYRTSRLVIDEEAAVAAAALMAFGGVPVLYSQEIRYYAPVLFYACGTLWALAEARYRSRSLSQAAPYWAAFIFFQLLNLLLHPQAVYVLTLSVIGIAGRGAWLRFEGQREESSRWLIGGSGAVLAVTVACAFIPEYGHLFSQIVSQWSAGPVWTHMYWMVPRPQESLPSQLGVFLLLGDVKVRWLGMGAAAVLAWGAVANWRRRRGLLAFGATWILLPILSLFVVRARVIFEMRYFVFMLPVVHLLLACGARGILATWGPPPFGLARRLALVAAALLLCLPSLQRHYSWPSSGWKEALAYIERESSPADAIGIHPLTHRIAAEYYGTSERRAVYFASLPSDIDGSVHFQRMSSRARRRTSSLTAEQMSRSHPRIWLAASLLQLDQEKARFSRTCALLAPYYDLKDSKRFNARQEVIVYVFERRRVGISARRSPPKEPARGTVFRRPAWFFGNITDLAPALPPESSGYALEVLDPPERPRAAQAGAAAARRRFFAALIRSRRGEARFLPQKAGEESLLYAWSGRGRLHDGAASLAFESGDILRPTCAGGCRVEAFSSEALLVMLKVPTRPKAPLAAQRRLGPLKLGHVSVESPRAGSSCDERQAARDGVFNVSVDRISPSDPQGCRRSGHLIGLSLHLRASQAEIFEYASPEDRRYPYKLHYQAGDIYALWLRPGDSSRSVHFRSRKGDGAREQSARLVISLAQD